MMPTKFTLFCFLVLFTVQNTDPNCPWLTNWVEVRILTLLLIIYNCIIGNPPPPPPLPESSISHSKNCFISIISLYIIFVYILLLFCINRPFYSCGSVTRPMNGSEAAGDFVLIQSSLLFLCKCRLVGITTTQFT